MKERVAIRSPTDVIEKTFGWQTREGDRDHVPVSLSLFAGNPQPAKRKKGDSS